MSSVRSGRPSNRNITVGLPSGPRARSTGRYETRERVTEHDRRERGNKYDSYSSGPVDGSRTMRTQRSVADMSRVRGGRGERASYSGVPDVPPLPRSRRSEESSASSRSASSSSASSTFVDRIKGHSGYASSRTSLEDEVEPRKEMGGRWRQRTANMPGPEHGREDGGNTAQSDYGFSLWSRVATAANSLTVTVSNAWASNVTAHSGEQTPPGEESRLTQAMKAYHLEKARDPTDLPPWLFEEHERRPLGRLSGNTMNRGSSGPDNYEIRDSTAPPRGHGLRDIYDTAAAAAPPPSRQERREMSRGRQDDVSGGHSSKANDRLRALRDARRNAVQRTTLSVSQSGLESTDEERSSARGEYSRVNGSFSGVRAPSHGVGVRRGVGLPPRPSSRQ